MGSASPGFGPCVAYVVRAGVALDRQAGGAPVAFRARDRHLLDVGLDLSRGGVRVEVTVEVRGTGRGRDRATRVGARVRDAGPNLRLTDDGRRSAGHVVQQGAHANCTQTEVAGVECTYKHGELFGLHLHVDRAIGEVTSGPPARAVGSRRLVAPPVTCCQRAA
eukprot:scaffold88597_cov40-Phaeocystis_antarctica.AAC.1